MSRTRQGYPPEFRRQLVELVQAGQDEEQRVVALECVVSLSHPRGALQALSVFRVFCGSPSCRLSQHETGTRGTILIPHLFECGR